MRHQARFVLVLILLAAATFAADAADDKRFELTPFIGYRFNGDFDNVSDPTGQFRSLDLPDGESYGLIFDLGMGENAEIEFSWSRQENDLKGQLYSGGSVTLTGLTVDYYQIGGNYVMGDSFDDTRGFVGASFGTTYFGPDYPYSSDTKFAFAFQGGIKHYFGDSFGIRAQGRLVSTYINSSPGYWCYYYCYYVSTSNYQVTGEVDLGLIVKF